MMYLGNQPVGLTLGEKREEWTYVIKPTDKTDLLINAVQTRLEVGQKLTIEWDLPSDAGIYTNRYVWRCIGAILDGESGAYAGQTMALITTEVGVKGRKTWTVNTAGNILFGGYSNGAANTSCFANSLKVLIENPEV